MPRSKSMSINLEIYSHRTRYTDIYIYIVTAKWNMDEYTMWCDYVILCGYYRIWYKGIPCRCSPLYVFENLFYALKTCRCMVVYAFSIIISTSSQSGGLWNVCRIYAVTLISQLALTKFHNWKYKIALIYISKFVKINKVCIHKKSYFKYT